ncbi:hypothetical protein HJO_17354, partial [Hyphomonas johnsonii MHS-2]
MIIVRCVSNVRRLATGDVRIGAQSTTHEDPIYDVDGILHYCV